MPRKPTGRGRGRPLGSGQLGIEGIDQKRLTIRLPMSLYEALEALAGQEHYTREEPDMARCVREALEHYLACPHRRQTKNVPHVSLADNRQTRNTPETLGDIRWQTENVPEPLGDNKRQTEKSTPVYDNTKYVLGKLCPRGHDYQGTGQSLLRRVNLGCLECDKEKARERRQQKLQGA